METFFVRWCTSRFNQFPFLKPLDTTTFDWRCEWVYDTLNKATSFVSNLCLNVDVVVDVAAGVV